MNTFFNTIVAMTLAACLASAPCQALVGESELNGPMATHAVMVLARSKGGAGFCTGVVIAPDVALTAAHCVAKLGDTMIFIKSPEAPVMLAPQAIAVHPGYKADAVRKREKSIDLALIRMADPLPAPFRPAPLDSQGGTRLGLRYAISGYGVTREGDGLTGGLLRWGTLQTRAPLSNILLWAEDPANKGFGACEGDSGGPIFDIETGAVVAITSWSEGSADRRCGKLTQAALIAPQMAWIDRILRGWGVTR